MNDLGNAGKFGRKNNKLSDYLFTETFANPPITAWSIILSLFSS